MDPITLSEPTSNSFTPHTSGKAHKSASQVALFDNLMTAMTAVADGGMKLSMPIDGETGEATPDNGAQLLTLIDAQQMPLAANQPKAETALSALNLAIAEGGETDSELDPQTTEGEPGTAPEQLIGHKDTKVSASEGITSDLTDATGLPLDPETNTLSSTEVGEDSLETTGTSDQVADITSDDPSEEAIVATLAVSEVSATPISRVDPDTKLDTEIQISEQKVDPQTPKEVQVAENKVQSAPIAAAVQPATIPARPLASGKNATPQSATIGHAVQPRTSQPKGVNVATPQEMAEDSIQNAVGPDGKTRFADQFKDAVRHTSSPGHTAHNVTVDAPVEVTQSPVNAPVIVQPDGTVDVQAEQPAIEGQTIKAEAEPIDTTADNWTETISAQIEASFDETGGEVDLLLTPETLGSVRIRMEVRDGTAQVTIVTETSEAAKLFNQNEARLSEMLSKNGLTLTSQDASTGDRRDGSGQSRGHTGGAMGTDIEESALTETVKVTSNLVNLIA